MSDRLQDDLGDHTGFLRGGGALGCLIAGFDWTATPLGPINRWPHSLRTATDMILRSPLAMVLLWGRDGIMLYNDPYAVIAGRRHPQILGTPAAAAFPEIAAFNRHVIEVCLGGGVLSYQNRRFTLFRNGTAEDVWLDLNYSPVPDDTGHPAGVLAVVVDTTARNLADERLRIAQEAGRFGTFEWYPRQRRMIASDPYLALFGLPPGQEVSDETLVDLVVPDDRALTGPRRLDHDDTPLTYAEYRIRHAGTGALRWIARRGQTLEGADSGTNRFVGVAWDITERKQAERDDDFLAEVNENLRNLIDAGEVVSVASAMLGRFLGVGRVGYGKIDPDGTHFIVERDWTDGRMPGFVGTHALGDFGEPILLTFQAGETLRLEDVRTDRRTRGPGVRQAFAAIGMRAGIAVPLIRDGRFVGALYAHDAAARQWEDREEAVLRAVAARVWDAAQRAEAERGLRESEERFRLFAQAMPHHVWSSDPTGRPTWFNQQVYQYSGTNPGDLDGMKWLSLVHPEDQAETLTKWRAALRDGQTYEAEYRVRRADGDYRWHLVRALPLRDGGGRISHWIGTSTDIEDQRRALDALARLNATLEQRVEERSEKLRQAEEALRQSQKMEAIGQLTGGIAHDFNNLLTGIIGSLELVRRRIASGRLSDLDRFIDAATTSGQRAAALTQRLLAFARRQSLDTKPVRVDALVADMEDLLARTLGEQVRMSIDVTADIWPAMVDPNQLESAILNLAINARDAMPDGGRLTIAAANLKASAIDPASGLESDDHVILSVTDTGIGMTPDVLDKVFEPFFTTKPIGHGTGLGLSMVYGFTRQSGGQVRIRSAPGDGTTVTLFLPRARHAVTADPPPPARPPAGTGETVLVVEDDPAVRMLVLEILHDLGYRALQAGHAHEALPLLESDQPIDLLVSDVGLPGLSGRQLADQARALRPQLKVLLVTGYAEHATTRSGFLAEGMAMLTKPFAIEVLASKISEMMA